MQVNKDKCVLYVESQNDQHVFYHLLQHYQVPDVFIVEPKGGISTILKTVAVELIKQDEDRLQRIGIVLDADEDIEARWQELLHILERKGYTNVPQHPEATGTLIIQADMPVIGIWIMPDNTVPGELEHFIEFLVPGRETNNLWQYAKEVVDNLPEQRFAEQKKMKAYVHSWLAWQEQPGTPMGWAIGKKYLDPDVPEAERLMQWIHRLFLADDS